eukprot:TRINITY_DN13267_c0_g2_i4.p1 TRINITY_DN13267_c0_g2~~TRINITY_DN13267_c0_g2_i4.p1  ORF type:complete len:143 (-),score=10.42 TRINITY_DN13267_c0_g2_i4:119-547(-)
MDMDFMMFSKSPIGVEDKQYWIRDWNTFSSKQFLLQKEEIVSFYMLLICADIWIPMYHLSIGYQWAYNVMEESHQQGFDTRWLLQCASFHKQTCMYEGWCKPLITSSSPYCQSKQIALCTVLIMPHVQRCPSVVLRKTSRFV